MDLMVLLTIGTPDVRRDVEQTSKELGQKDAQASDVQEFPGLLSMLTIPGGGTLGIYEPKHPVAATI